jgi:hypothetical protein
MKNIKFLPTILSLIFTALLVVIVLQMVVIQKKQSVNNDDNIVEDVKDDVVIDQGEVIPQKERLIDGALISMDEKEKTLKAITIENNIYARPQSGIDKANLVLEVPVEGGITRFLAIFDGSEDVLEIGPVRSARPYFLDWAKEYDSLYSHVGGSPEALKTIKNDKNIANLNQYFQSQYYWRSSKRQRPHNVYTSIELLDRAVRDFDLNVSGFDSWKFKEDLKLEDRGGDKSEIFIDYSTRENEVKWIYNQENNDYIRYQAREKHLTKDNEWIRSKNIIIQKTKVLSIDSEDRKAITVIGSGEAIIFLDGNIIEGSWKKESQNKRTMFYNENDEEIEFNRGITWIEVVSNKTILEF